jgi:hypothetical protein
LENGFYNLSVSYSLLAKARQNDLLFGLENGSRRGECWQLIWFGKEFVTCLSLIALLPSFRAKTRQNDLLFGLENGFITYLSLTPVSKSPPK